MLCGLVFALVPMVAAGISAPRDVQPEAVKRPAETRTGEQVFQQNCGRCHQKPSILAPRVTGTVIMHMRTRARLSGDDEKLLLKFLAP